jgi:nucleoid DNA-binding protein
MLFLLAKTVPNFSFPILHSQFSPVSVYYITSMPITKSNLINDTAISSSAQRDSVKVVVEQLFSVIKDFVKEGRSLELRGFGTFSPKKCSPRKARNLRTGELIPMSESKSVTFKFSAGLKNKVTKPAKATKPKKATAKEPALSRKLAKTGSL